MSNYLPIEIVEQVLLRLPIKPLLHCLSICKTWYNLITNTKFISAHLDFIKSLPNSTHLFLEYDYDYVEKMCNYSYALYSVDKPGTFEEYTKFEFKDENSKPTCCLHVFGSCNGLICLANEGWSYRRFHAEKVVLWNPAIRKSLDLPRSYTQFSSIPRVYHHVFGFLFDHIRNDYKVLRILGLDGHPCKYIEVFRLSTGLWEDISYKAPIDWITRISPLSRQVDLNGIAHWIGKKDYGTSELRIISFDAHEEVFDNIKLPFDVVNDDENHWQSLQKYLFVFDESLFLIRKVNRKDAYEKNKWKFDIWRMGDYNVVESWNKVYTWILDESVQPLCFRKNGEILWVMKEVKLISTNLKDASVNYLGICHNAIDHSSYLYCTESLILLDKSLSKRQLMIRN